MPIGGSLSLKQLRARGFTDARIAEIGGTIQGANVIFKDKIGGFNSVGEIIRLPPREIARQQFDDLPEAEREIANAVVAAERSSINGLGDVVEAGIKALGLDRAAKLYERLTGKSCGCDARRKWLNKLWPLKI